MSYVLGIDIGGSTTTAAVCRYAGDVWSAVHPVPLDAGSSVLESMLEFADGAFVAGARTDGGIPDDANVARGFIRRVGDDAPLVVGGGSFQPQTLVAALTRWVIEVLWQREEGPAEQVVLTHPAGWGPYRTQLLRQALTDAGLPEVALLPAALAVAYSHDADNRVPDSGTVGVLRIGGQGVEAALLDHPAPGVFAPLCAAGLAGIGGDALDDAFLSYLTTGTGRHAGGAHPSATDPVPRWRCVAARHHLSTATEVRVDCGSPGLGNEVPVARTEFDALARPILRAGVDLLLQVIRSAGVDPADLCTVLLAGGTARTPALAESLCESLPGPVARDTDPALTVATGAALAARWMSCGGRLTITPPFPGYGTAPARPAGRPAPPATSDAGLGPAPDLGPAPNLPATARPGAGPGAAGDPEPAGRPGQPPMRVTPLEVAGKNLMTAAAVDGDAPARRGRR